VTLSTNASTSDDPQGCLSARTDLLIHRTCDTWILADPANGRVHTLNASAMWIWHHCSGRAEASVLAQWLSEEAEIPLEQALADVTATLRALRALDLLETQ
jgi:hypothetical protein